MKLEYIDKNHLEEKNNVIKFWLGLSGIKFQFKNGQIIEVKGVEQCFIQERQSNEGV